MWKYFVSKLKLASIYKNVVIGIERWLVEIILLYLACYYYMTVIFKNWARFG